MIPVLVTAFSRSQSRAASPPRRSPDSAHPHPPTGLVRLAFEELVATLQDRRTS